MNDDMPWVDLTPEEIQQLRTNKQQLTQYGQDKIRQLMMNQEPYPDEMFEEAARREAANEVIVAKVSEEDYQKIQEEIANKKALEALDKLYDENGDALQQLSVIERQELINEALEELNAIVLGGQNTREFYLSISHIRNVLERLK
jgi:hypothetical protein